MKKHLIILPFIFISYSIFAQKSSYEISVNISHISSDKGQIIAKLYDSEEDFLKAETRILMANIKKGKSNVVFHNIAEGTYAIAVIHDENGNDKIDFNLLGIPSESLAASNNAKAFIIGPPSYADAKFSVKGSSVQQDIEMQ